MEKYTYPSTKYWRNTPSRHNPANLLYIRLPFLANLMTHTSFPVPKIVQNLKWLPLIPIFDENLVEIWYVMFQTMLKKYWKMLMVDNNLNFHGLNSKITDISILQLMYPNLKLLSEKIKIKLTNLKMHKFIKLAYILKVYTESKLNKKRILLHF